MGGRNEKTHTHKNIALLLSGGTGTRLGSDIPKQYIEICGRPIISFCMERLFHHIEIDALQIVADKAWHKFIIETAKQLNVPAEKFKGFSEPGKTRQLSILNALEDIRSYAKDTDYVLIHDAARPLLSETQITECLNAMATHDGIIPVLPIKDTVYRSMDGNHISSLLKRNELFAGQAPEVFLLGKYYEANKRLLPNNILTINGSTEPAVMAGMDIAMISGDEKNFKITTKEDLYRFQKIVEEGKIKKQ